MRRRAAFTLLEICIALFIALLMLTLAVPGMMAMLAEQRLKASFDRFDGWVRTARERSVTERRTYAMVWSEEGIELRAVERRDTDAEDAEPERFVFTEGETFKLGRPSALMKEPPGEWVFWRSGLENRWAEIESGAVQLSNESAEELKPPFDGMTLKTRRVDVEKVNENNEKITGISAVTLTVVWTSDGDEQTKELLFYLNPRQPGGLPANAAPGN